jgi:transcriptional regulator with XRE-family HTH domain
MVSEDQLSYQLNLGQCLFKLRTRLKLSQEKLAEAIGATARSISRWEHNEAIPQQHYQEKLCEVLQIPLDVLFGFTDEIHQGASQPDLAPLWHVPYARNIYFTGFEKVLLQLRGQLHAQLESALIQPQIVNGLGGIGKTQIALEYAYRFRNDYQALLWVRAETYEMLMEDYQTIAHLLQIPHPEDQELCHIVAAVKRQLQNYDTWLFICDGAEDLNQAHALLPDASLGHVIITTRSQAIGTLGAHVDLRKMETAEAALFLLRRAKCLSLTASLQEAPAWLRTHAETLVEMVDGCPLALDQAGAYIEETGCGLLEYMNRYRTQHSVLLNTRGTLSNYHPASVAETLTHSFQKVEQALPGAIDLLRLCAFLHPDAIPEEVIIEGMVQSEAGRQIAVADPFTLDAAAKELRSLSLLYREAESKTFAIHRLVQTIIKDMMDMQTRHWWATYAIQALEHVFPDLDDGGAWPRCQRYLPHVLTCARYMEEEGITLPDADELFYRIGCYLSEYRAYNEAGLYSYEVPDIIISCCKEYGRR